MLHIARERAALRAIVPLESVDFLDHVPRGFAAGKREGGQRAFLLRIVCTEIVVEPMLVSAVLLEAKPEFRRVRKGEVVRQVMAKNAEAQGVFRRELFSAGDGLPRERLGEYMDLALAFQREVRV